MGRTVSSACVNPAIPSGVVSQRSASKSVGGVFRAYAFRRGCRNTGCPSASLRGTGAWGSAGFVLAGAGRASLAEMRHARQLRTDVSVRPMPAAPATSGDHTGGPEDQSDDQMTQYVMDMVAPATSDADATTRRGFDARAVRIRSAGDAAPAAAMPAAIPRSSDIGDEPAANMSRGPRAAATEIWAPNPNAALPKTKKTKTR